ncbi:unnamed protein product [Brachionus calyciflorus]|uniref:C-type lectin domain-containing protein n=1 Tax=Brachionus calyciflorus TaxID=104777 RepID=A0A813ZGL8_9BILA|nr:unnamed protein product [Brachionus calyciflorus]
MNTPFKYSCLQMCSIDSSCAYVFFEKRDCILYSIDAFNNLSLSSDKIIYQKMNFEFQEKLTLDLNQSLFDFECLNSTNFWSLKTNSCLPCRTGFIKYSELPFTCYHNQTDWKNFAESKSYCKSKGGGLFRPKTKNERYFFTQRFPNKTANVYSTITYVGQKFKWPDGSDVVGFGRGEPNNYNSKSIFKEGCLIIRSDGFFNDISCGKYSSLTICQHD